MCHWVKKQESRQVNVRQYIEIDETNAVVALKTDVHCTQVQCKTLVAPKILTGQQGARGGGSFSKHCHINAKRQINVVYGRQ
jgi:hypothetical protein